MLGHSQWSKEDLDNISLQLQESEHYQWIGKRLFPSSRILEAGCGLAKWVKFFHDHGFDAYGLDFSEVAISTSLSRWPVLNLICDDLRSMPYDDNFFDLIVSFGAIEHDEEGPDKILLEMRRVLKQGGILYCTVPCINHIRGLGFLAIRDWIVCNNTIRRLTGRKSDAAFFEYVWTPKEYSEILTRAGFKIVDLVPLSPPCNILGSAGTIQRNIIELIHQRFPWLMAHMMAGICQKL